jgi:hypothetical protein
LEISLLTFACTYKTHVIGDARILLLGAQSFNSPDDNFNSADKLENETVRSYNHIAGLMDFAEMQEVMGVFAQKILENLLYTNGSDDDGKRVIETTLNVLDHFISTQTSCRMFCKLEVIQQLISNHMVSTSSISYDCMLMCVMI